MCSGGVDRVYWFQVSVYIVLKLIVSLICSRVVLPDVTILCASHHLPVVELQHAHTAMSSRETVKGNMPAPSQGCLIESSFLTGESR